MLCYKIMPINKVDVLAILPTYNEAKNIKLIINQLFDSFKDLKKYRLRILVVDDKSPDGTANVVEECIKTNSQISMISGDKKGLGEAYIRGIKHGVSEFNPAYLLMMDSDLSHDPYTVPDMVKAAEDGADLVIGSRYIALGYIPGNWPIIRIINSKVASSVAYILTGIDRDIKDLTSGFRLVRASKLNEVNLNKIETKGYGFLIHILYLLISKGARVTEVPIVFRERLHGSSKLSLKDVLEFIKCVYLLNPQSSPRKVVRFTKVGLVGSVVNLGVLYFLKTYSPVSLVVCSLIAIEISIISNFIFHNLYTFKNTNAKKPIAVRMFRYNAASVLTALLTVLVFHLLVSYLNIFYLSAQFIAICVSFVANYLISNRFVWGKHAAG